MKKNVGTTDRVFRTSIAVLIGILLITGTLSGMVATILGVVAIALLLTSAISFCPAYFPFGMSTCKQNPPPTR